MADVKVEESSPTKSPEEVGCFFCFKRCKGEEKGNPGVLFFQFFPLQNVCKYLRIDFGKLYKEAEMSSLSSDQTDDLGNSGFGPDPDAEVPICSNCWKVSRKFSKLYQRLQEIELKLIKYLERLLNNMWTSTNADKSESRLQILVKSDIGPILLQSPLVLTNLRSSIANLCEH